MDCTLIRAVFALPRRGVVEELICTSIVEKRGQFYLGKVEWLWGGIRLGNLPNNNLGG